MCNQHKSLDFFTQHGLLQKIPTLRRAILKVFDPKTDFRTKNRTKKVGTYLFKIVLDLLCLSKISDSLVNIKNYCTLLKRLFFYTLTYNYLPALLYLIRRHFFLNLSYVSTVHLI